MKPIFFASLFFCLFACDSEQTTENNTHVKEVQATKTPDNDLSKLNLVGKMKSREDWEYKAIIKDGYVTNGEVIKGSKVNYNEQGNEVELTNYDNEKKLVSNWKYQYDKKGYRTESVFTADTISTKTISKYDDKGNCIELLEYANNSQVGRTTYIFDDKNQELESNAVYDEGGTSSKSRITHIYDEKGNKQEGVFYNESGVVNFKYFYIYDKAGNEIQRTIFTGDNAPSYKYTKQYDAKGNMTQREDFNVDGSLIYKRSYKYDEKSNVIEALFFESNGEVNPDYCSKYTYEYDNQGNWIVMIQYNYNDVAQLFTERKIAYYD